MAHFFPVKWLSLQYQVLFAQSYHQLNWWILHCYLQLSCSGSGRKSGNQYFVSFFQVFYLHLDTAVLKYTEKKGVSQYKLQLVVPDMKSWALHASQQLLCRSCAEILLEARCRITIFNWTNYLGKCQVNIFGRVSWFYTRWFTVLCMPLKAYWAT